MKRTGRKMIAWLLLTAMLMAFCAGCASKEAPAQPAPDSAPATQPTAESTEQPGAATPEPVAPAAPEVDYAALYAPVLDKAYDLLSGGFDPDENVPDAPNGIIEMAGMSQFENPANQLMRVGYLIEDLNGDGVAELLIGTMPEGEQGLDRNGEIFGGYTCRDGEPVLFLEGWSRNLWRWMGGGRFYNFGSGGAAYSEFSAWQLDPDAAELRCEDFWFSDVAADDPGKQIFFHNTTGAWEKETSEQVNMDGDTFWGMSAQLEAQCRPLPMTQLVRYEPVSVPAFAGGSKVFASFLEEAEPAPDHYMDAAAQYGELFPTGREFETEVLFYTFTGVRDFKFLALELTDVDENGHADFRVTELFTLPELRAETPLAVPMDFPGDIPSNGFSYVDADGVTKLFAVSLSGMDGSLVISAID